jgi:hypothetical protein
MSLVSDVERARQLVDSAAAIGNRLSIVDATEALSAPAQLRAQGIRRVELKDLKTWSCEQRRLFRSWCRVMKLSSRDGQTRHRYDLFLRELSRIELEGLHGPGQSGGHNSQSQIPSERAWIEANGY